MQTNQTGISIYLPIRVESKAGSGHFQLTVVEANRESLSLGPDEYYLGLVEEKTEWCDGVKKSKVEQYDLIFNPVQLYFSESSLLFFDDVNTLGSDLYRQDDLVHEVDYDEAYIKKSHFIFLIDNQYGLLEGQREWSIAKEFKGQKSSCVGRASVSGLVLL